MTQPTRNEDPQTTESDFIEDDSLDCGEAGIFLTLKILYRHIFQDWQILRRGVWLSFLFSLFLMMDMRGLYADVAQYADGNLLRVFLVSAHETNTLLLSVIVFFLSLCLWYMMFACIVSVIACFRYISGLIRDFVDLFSIAFFTAFGHFVFAKLLLLFMGISLSFDDYFLGDVYRLGDLCWLSLFFFGSAYFVRDSLERSNDSMGFQLAFAGFCMGVVPLPLWRFVYVALFLGGNFNAEVTRLALTLSFGVFAAVLYAYKNSQPDAHPWG